MTEEGLERLARDLQSDLRTNRAMEMIQMAEIAEQYSKDIGVQCQAWFIGGPIGGFLVPVEKENEE